MKKPKSLLALMMAAAMMASTMPAYADEAAMPDTAIEVQTEASEEVQETEAVSDLADVEVVDVSEAVEEADEVTDMSETDEAVEAEAVIETEEALQIMASESIEVEDISLEAYNSVSGSTTMGSAPLCNLNQVYTSGLNSLQARYYKIKTPAAKGFYAFHAKNINVDANNYNNRMYIQLVNPGESIIRSYEVMGLNKSFNNFVPLESNSTYYIKVYSQHSTSGNFEFAVSYYADKEPDMIEEVYNTVPLNTMVEGSIDYGYNVTDVDYFSFTTGDSTDYTFKVTNGYGMNSLHAYILDRYQECVASLTWLKTGETKTKDVTLSPNTRYYVKVTGQYIDNYNYAFGINEVGKPNPVTNLRATASGKNKVTLTWSPAEGAVGYMIYGKHGSDGAYGYVGMTTTGCTFTDSKASDQDYNFYWVYAYGTTKNGKKIIGSCQKYTFAKGICPAVTSFRANSQINGVRLMWNRSSGAEGYLIYGIRANGSYGYVGMATSTSFIDTKASRTGWNFYWVFPYHRNADGRMVTGNTAKYVYGKKL